MRKKFQEGGEVEDDQSPPRQPSLIERMAGAARRDPILGPISRGVGALRRATRPKRVEELEQRMRKRSKRTTDDEDDGPEEIQNIRKGGPVKAKYAEGGMVEIEIKVGGGGKHKMPDGSMMEDDEMESEDYKKGGRVKKMAKGGITNKKFIQQAIKKPGALRAQLGAKAGQNIPAKKLATAAKAPGKLGQRARFAQTLAKMRKK